MHFRGWSLGLGLCFLLLRSCLGSFLSGIPGSLELRWGFSLGHTFFGGETREMKSSLNYLSRRISIHLLPEISNCCSWLVILCWCGLSSVCVESVQRDTWMFIGWLDESHGCLFGTSTWRIPTRRPKCFQITSISSHYLWGEHERNLRALQWRWTKRITTIDASDNQPVPSIPASGHTPNQGREGCIGGREELPGGEWGRSLGGKGR